MLKTLAAYLEGYKKYALLAPLFVILEVVCELILPRVMAKIVDVGIETGDVPYIVAMGAVMASTSAFKVSSADPRFTGSQPAPSKEAAMY